MLLALVVCIVTENVKNMKINLEVNLIFVKGSNHYDSISGMQDNEHVTHISGNQVPEECLKLVVNTSSEEKSRYKIK